MTTATEKQISYIESMFNQIIAFAGKHTLDRQMFAEFAAQKDTLTTFGASNYISHFKASLSAERFAASSHGQKIMKRYA